MQSLATYDSTNNRVVIAYSDAGNSEYGTAIVGTVSGTSISFGTAVVFESAATYSTGITYDSTNARVVIAYQTAETQITVLQLSVLFPVHLFHLVLQLFLNLLVLLVTYPPPTTPQMIELL